jgi:hypothetical protein
MRSTTLNELKKELQEMPPKELVELCLSLAKYKKDNKEYLGYLIFESHDKSGFSKEIQSELDLHFEALLAQTNLYYVKKSLRKILRLLGKYSKYLNDKAVSAELYIYFLTKLKNSGIPYEDSKLIVNLYDQQLKKIKALVSTLHEDLQNDFAGDLSFLKS